jgi:heat shock protein HslJ
MPERYLARFIAHWACLGLLALMTACQGSLVAAADPFPAKPQLPASYRGALPCAGCVTASAQLDLWPDGTFHLRRNGPPGDELAADEVGRWRMDPEVSTLLLYGGHEAPLRMLVVGSRTLRALDSLGQPAGPDDAFDLQTDGSLQPADLSLRLHGMFTYLADAARFEECLTGRSYPVAQERDYFALAREYLTLARSAPGVPVLASFDGALEQRPRMAGEGTEQAVIVRRITGLWPGQSCDRAMSHASLSNQYWRVDRLRGRRVTSLAASPGDVFLILRGDQGGYVANAGCGRYAGSYRVSGTSIAFAAPEKHPDCPPALRVRQQMLLDTLAAVRTWAIQGQVLELFDASGLSLAALEAVYLR